MLKANPPRENELGVFPNAKKPRVTQSQKSPLNEDRCPQGTCWSLFKILIKTKKLIIQYKTGADVSWQTFN